MIPSIDTTRPRFTESDLTPAEVVARADALIPELVARQAETERRSFYAEDMHEYFKQNGFYRILVPRRYGGYEFGIETFFRVSMALARGCPSTGWMFCLGATHALVAATLFDERAQDELFSDGDFICPAATMPTGSAERTPDGQWAISGTWPYCSGAPYATHFMGQAIISEAGKEPEPLLFVMPRSQWERLDDWGQQLGLKGSGSHSITVRNAIIGDHLTVRGHLSQVRVTAGTPGLALHGNPEYCGAQLCYMTLEAASLAVGMARGALDVYEEVVCKRTTLLPPITIRAEDPDYQFWYGDAAAMIDTAEAALTQAIRQWHDFCKAGPAAFTREQDLRIAAICRHVIRLCWGAVKDYLFPTVGSSSVREGDRFERIWRDLSTMQSHLGLSVLLPTNAVRELGRVRLGVE